MAALDEAGSRRVMVRVPAKINLYLRVVGSRPDGFHDLVTVFQAVSLFDDVAVEAAEHFSVGVQGEGSDAVPTGPGNLAWQAAQLLAERTGAATGAAITITKRIPVGGGMAGGSADAAATLAACAALWQLGSTRAELAELAAELGSDVAFPLLGGTAIGTGRGEQLTAVLAPGRLHWALALADHGISAADAYRQWDRQHPDSGLDPDAADPMAATEELLEALRSGDPARVAGALHNDLESAALALDPPLARTLATGRELGALAGIISGSGPTCAFLCADEVAATRLAAALAAEGVCRTTRVVSSPVPGVHLSSPA